MENHKVLSEAKFRKHGTEIATLNLLGFYPSRANISSIPSCELQGESNFIIILDFN